MKHLFVFCILLGLTACETEVTQFLVTLDTDLNIPDELDEVRVRFIDVGGRPKPETKFRMDAPNLNQTISFALVPGESPPEQTITLEFSAWVKGTLLFTQTLNTHFLSKKKLGLTIFLARLCADSPELCADPLIIDPNDLIELPASTTVRTDSNHDAGMPQADAGN